MRTILILGAAVAGIMLQAGLAQRRNNMDLGTFSVSLAVKDLKASRAFYEKFGFEAIDGKEEQRWLILRKGSAIIGLFQGMFDKNTLTFNPTDVRSVQKQLKASGVTFTKEANEDGKGPAFAALFDPDGNPVLLDQHNP